MSKCVQIRIGEKIFKFPDIDLENSVYNIENIMRAIRMDSRYNDSLEDLITNIQGEYSKKETTEITDITTYADTVLGEITPLALAATMRDAGKSSEDIEAITSMIGRNSEGIIKINESLKEPTVYLGNKRTLIGVPTSGLSSDKLYSTLEYVYLDSKIKNTASNVYKTVNDLWYDFKENTLINGGEVSKAFLEDLDKLDSVNRNKRLLAYIFNPSLNEENIELFDLYKTRLKDIVQNAISLKKSFYSGKVDPSIYSLFNLSNPTPVKLSQNVTLQLGDVATLLKEYRSLDKKEKASLFVQDIPNGISPRAFLIQKVISRLVEINPNGSYDANLLSIYYPSQLQFILNNAETLYELVDVTDGIQNNIENVLQNIVIDNRPVKNSNIPLSRVNIEIGSNLSVVPSRRIKFSSYESNINNAKYILKIAFDKSINSDYKLEKNTLIVNPNGFNGNTNINIPTFPSNITTVYMPYIEGTTEIYSEVLHALANAGYIKNFITDGVENQSVRLVIDANNLGLNVEVRPKDGVIKSSISGEPISSEEFIDRFSYIMPPLPGALQPKMKFYDWRSRTGYEFTNRRGNINFNTLLSEMEDKLPSDVYLDYFDLTSKGVISSLILSKADDNKALVKTNIGTTIDLMDSKTDRLFRFTIADKSKLNASFTSVEDEELHFGDIYTDGKYTYVLINTSEDNMFMVKYINETKPIRKSISKEDFSKLTFTKTRALSKNGVINLHNIIYIDSNGEIKTPSLEMLYDFYKEELEQVSEDSGFSVEFIKRKKYNTKNAFSNMTIVKLKPEGSSIDTKSYDNGLPNFSGKLFIERLAHKLNTPVHFLTTTQLNALGDNFGKSKGLIYKGEIYINKDRFSEDRGVVLHELSHVLLSYFKENNYEGYLQLLNETPIENGELDNLRNLYPELTNQDLREEHLAERFAKSFNTLFSDPILDDTLVRLDFVDSVKRILDLSNDIPINMRELMTTTLKDIANKSKECNTVFGEIFPRATMTWGAISNIKSKFLRSTDESNNLKELNCR